MTGQFIKYKSHLTHYYKIGSGPKIILAFHGFGLDGTCFKPFETHLGKEFTIYSFDLFYHGKSHWGDNTEPLTKSFWNEFLTYFLKKHAIDRFSILCFSLGGKFALSTVESFPSQIDKVILLAPDGIKTSMWYNLATYPLFFQKLFRSMIVKPNRFFNLINALKKLRLVDKGILKFAKSQMNTVKKRRRVYYSWIIFKDLKFNMSTIANTINHHQIKLVMILGDFDKIITKKGMSRLLNKLSDSQLIFISSGHNDLIKNASNTSDFMEAF